jgi:hypothetical protein
MDANTNREGDTIALHPPEIVSLLRGTKASMSTASGREAELAIVRFAAGALERLGDGGDGVGDLSDFAIDVRGIDADVVQHAISRGIAEVLDERAERQTALPPNWTRSSPAACRSGTAATGITGTATVRSARGRTAST